MKTVDVKIEELVTRETERIKKRRPFLENVNVSYEDNGKGSYFSKIKARTKNKTIFLAQENRCPETAIRKAFNNLSKLLTRKKYKRGNKLSFDLKEVA